MVRSVVSVLKSGSNGLGSGCAGSTALCSWTSWTRHSTLIVSLSIQEYTRNQLEPELDSVLTSHFHFKETSQIKTHWSSYTSA